MSQSQKPPNPQEGMSNSRVGWARAAGTFANSQTAAAFARAGFPDATLILRWPESVGADVARFAEPVRLQQGPEGAVLTLKCEPGAAVFLQHQTRSLIERLNAYLGAGRIVRLKFVPGSLAPAQRVPDHPAKARPGMGKMPAESEGKPSLASALERLARLRGTRAP